MTGYRLSPLQQSASEDHLAIKRCSLIHWFAENASRYSAAEQESFRARMMLELTERHNKAYWERNFRTVPRMPGVVC